jgi:PTH1 family peptidyl-tRNA hydrolase
MLLFVGLGNPGSDYARNRHNAGFIAVDRLAQRHGFSDWKAKSGALIADGRLGTQKVLLIKPQSFMNKSGLPVAEIARFYKIPAGDIFVFYDEIDLAVGKIRLKQGGGHGGHNGIRDLDRHLGVDYWRVRIGVGRPPARIDVKNWVLMDFAKDEVDGWLDDLTSAMADEADRLVSHDTEGFQSRVAFLAPAPKTETPPKTLRTQDSPNGG